MNAFDLTGMCSAVAHAAEDISDGSRDSAEARRCRARGLRCCDARRCCRGGASPNELRPPANRHRYEVAAEGWEELEEARPEGAEDEEQRQLREMLEQAMGVTVRQCPFCNAACVKEDEDDCDHIFCRCGREFCWQCLADREVIFHHGNHYHKPGCPFHFDFEEKQLKLNPDCPQCQKNGRACVPPRTSAVRPRGASAMGGS